MAGEEQIGSGIEDKEIDIRKIVEGIKVNAVWKWSDMGQTDEKSSSNGEKGHGLQPEGDFPRIKQTVNTYNCPKYDRAVNEGLINIYNRDI